MIKNLICDIGGVLQKEDWDGPAKVMSSVRKTSAPEFRNAVLKNRVYHLDLYQTNKISSKEFCTFILNNLGLEANDNNLKLVRQAIKIIWSGINKELINIISKLKVNKKVLLSNSWIELEQSAKEKDYLKHFDHTYFSHLVGLKKPDKKYFLYVLKQEGFKPEETLFIDNKKANIEAAKEVGIKTITFISNDKVVEELKKLSLI